MKIKNLTPVGQLRHRATRSDAFQRFRGRFGAPSGRGGRRKGRQAKLSAATATTPRKRARTPPSAGQNGESWSRWVAGGQIYQIRGVWIVFDVVIVTVGKCRQRGNSQGRLSEAPAERSRVKATDKCGFRLRRVVSHRQRYRGGVHEQSEEVGETVAALVECQSSRERVHWGRSCGVDDTERN